jgi:hypothetical protein
MPSGKTSGDSGVRHASSRVAAPITIMRRGPSGQQPEMIEGAYIKVWAEITE